MGWVIENQCSSREIEVIARVGDFTNNTVAGLRERDPLAGDGVADVVVVVSHIIGSRRAEEEAMARVEDGCVGMGGQEAEGVIGAGALASCCWEVMISDGFFACGETNASDEES